MLSQSWLRNIVSVTLLALTTVACDPISTIFARAEFPRALDEPCILAALKAADNVVTAEEFDHGIAASILIPEDIPERYGFRRDDSSSRESFFGISQQPKDNGATELELGMVWVGGSETPEFESYVQGILDQLVVRIGERCTA